MKVLKFGGTSVGTTPNLQNVKRIVEGLDTPVVVVVSALGGLTDKLIATAHLAGAGDDAYQVEMQGIVERHHAIIADVVPQEYQERVMSQVDSLLDELNRTYQGVALLRDLPGRTLDTIVSFGERMSSIIVAAMISGACHYNSPDFIKTEKWYGKNIADSKLTNQLIKETLGDKDYRIAVVGGFISTDRDTGEITNLGRGGSDYTAALIAAALNADELQIWTDVDGFMTADPRIIDGAKVVDHMTFVESIELCSNGAKVIYPPTIYPVFHKNIPIRILNTFNPSAPGTLITDDVREDDLPVKGISAIRHTTLITVVGDTKDGADVNSRTYNAMSKNGVSVALVTKGEGAEGFSFAVSAPESGIAIKVLTDEFGPELSRGELDNISAVYKLSTIAVVGEGLKSIDGLRAHLRRRLESEGITIHAVSAEDASKTTLSVVVNSALTDKALKAMHEELFS